MEDTNGLDFICEEDTGHYLGLLVLADTLHI